MFREQDLVQLVHSFGQDLTLKSNSGESYNPQTGRVTKTEGTVNVKGYFSGYKSHDMDSINIRQGDRKLVLPPKDLNGLSYTKPQEGDTVTGEEGEVFIVSTQEIMSLGSPMCYICQVRK